MSSTKYKKTTKMTKKLSAKNSKILHDTMVTLGALKEASRLNELPMHEIQVHLLDEDGDGIVLCLEYDKQTGELGKTFYNVDEYYAEEVEKGNYEIEIELEDGDDPSTEPLDPYAKIPRVKSISSELAESIKEKLLEEVLSDEYDEVLNDFSIGAEYRNRRANKKVLLN